MPRNSAVMIPTHGRADNCKTIKTLRKQGYTGRIILIVDNEDGMLSDYERLGEEIAVFDKEEWAGKTDAMFPAARNLSVVVFARNAIFDVAEKKRLTHFMVIDDDALDFQWINPAFAKRIFTRRLDDVFNAYWDFLDAVPLIQCACLYQTGDMIGGRFSSLAQGAAKRKAMNVFFCKTDRPFSFRGALNEDVNTYAARGLDKVFLSFGNLILNQAVTQQNKGGLTDAYKAMSTWTKSFFSVIANPSAVKLSILRGIKNDGNKGYARVHHRISGNKCYPCILRLKGMGVDVDEG